MIRNGRASPFPNEFISPPTWSSQTGSGRRGFRLRRYPYRIGAASHRAFDEPAGFGLGGGCAFVEPGERAVGADHRMVFPARRDEPVLLEQRHDRPAGLEEGAIRVGGRARVEDEEALRRPSSDMQQVIG